MAETKPRRGRVYAYVHGSQCRFVSAFRPGEEYQGQKVSKHGDLVPWTHGKAATLAKVYGASSSLYDILAATAVAEALGWRRR